MKYFLWAGAPAPHMPRFRYFLSIRWHWYFLLIWITSKEESRFALEFWCLSLDEWEFSLLWHNSFLPIVSVGDYWLGCDLAKVSIVLHHRVIIVRVSEVQPLVVDEWMIWAKFTVIYGKRFIADSWSIWAWIIIRGKFRDSKDIISYIVSFR